MLKFLHTADIHLDSPLRSLALRNAGLQAAVKTATREALSNIITLALRENVAALLLCGDVFDSARRSAQTLAFLRLRLEKLNKAQIPVYYIKGNHDAENPLSDAMDWPSNVHIFSADGESFELPQKTADGRAVYLHGVSFGGKTAPNLLSKYPPPMENAVNIGLLHTSLNGAAGHDAYAPCSAAELAARGYDYWALGHIHKRSVYRQNSSLIVMPGCPQGRDIGEDGEKSATMLHIGANGANEIEEKILCDLAFLRLPVSVSGMEEAEELHEALRTALAEQSRSLRAPKAAVRIMLQGESKLHWQLRRDEDYWQKIAAELAESCGNLWLDKLELQLQNPQTESAAADDLPMEELAAALARAKNSAAMQRQCAESLKAVMNYLPPALRPALAADAEQEAMLLERLLAGGAEHITALPETCGQAPEQRQEV